MINYILFILGVFNAIVGCFALKYITKKRMPNLIFWIVFYVMLIGSALLIAISNIFYSQNGDYIMTDTTLRTIGKAVQATHGEWIGGNAITDMVNLIEWLRLDIGDADWRELCTIGACNVVVSLISFLADQGFTDEQIESLVSEGFEGAYTPF